MTATVAESAVSLAGVLVELAVPIEAALDTALEVLPALILDALTSRT